MLTQLSLFFAGCRGPASTVSKRNGGRWRGDTPWFQIGVYYNPSIVAHRTVGDHVMDHVGWNHRHPALHYLQLAKIAKGPSGAPAKLASSEVIDEHIAGYQWNKATCVCFFINRFTEKTSIGQITEPEPLFTSTTSTWLFYFVSLGRFGKICRKGWGNFISMKALRYKAVRIVTDCL